MTIAETQPKRRRSRLESIVRFLAWSTVVCLIAVPLFVIAMAYSQVFSFFLWRKNDDFQRVQDALFNPAASKSPEPKIVTNVLDRERARQIARLTALTGRPEMASGAATAVQFIIMSFEDVKPDAAEAISLPRQRVYEDGYRAVTLDMTQAPRDAIVLVSDQPVRWTVNGLPSRSWPRIGFEGYAAFDIVQGQPGSLAGFRIGAFGAGETLRVSEFARPSQRKEFGNQGPFCPSVQRWIDHFGLEFKAVQLTLLMTPTRIAPRDGAPSSDGDIARSVLGDEVEWLCRRR